MRPGWRAGPASSGAQQRSPPPGSKSDAGEEAAELAVDRARLVEAHLGDQALEVQRVAAEERDPPLPVVEPDAPGDHLDDAPGVPAPDHPVVAHQPAALP